MLNVLGYKSIEEKLNFFCRKKAVEDFTLFYTFLPSIYYKKCTLHPVQAGHIGRFMNYQYLGPSPTIDLVMYYFYYSPMTSLLLLFSFVIIHTRCHCPIVSMIHSFP